jgi:predicted nucleic acid-binding protein
MTEAIADTGPILHLYEIGQLECLGAFDNLQLPELVAEELRAYGLDPSRLEIATLIISIVRVPEVEWMQIVNDTKKPTIHPADAQVYVLARSNQFRSPVLTDDLDLRRFLENVGATVVGSVGVLVRAYKVGYLKHSELESAVEALFTTSTLHISRAFKAYVHRLLADLS